MTPSNCIEAKDSKRAGEKPEACPSFSPPMASGAFKKTGEDLSSWGRPCRVWGLANRLSQSRVPLWELEGQVPRAPHSTLPGFMRPQGSSVALSRRMVSTPTRPLPRAAAVLAQPDAVFPVHVPWVVRAWEATGKDPQRELPPPPARPCHRLPCPCLPLQLLHCPAALQGLDPEELLRVLGVYSSAVEIPVAHMPTMVPGGPENRAVAWPPPPALPHAPAGWRRTCESPGLQVLFSLHQDLRQPGDGHTHVGRIALSCGSSVRDPLTRHAQKLRVKATDGLRELGLLLACVCSVSKPQFPLGSKRTGPDRFPGRSACSPPPIRGTPALAAWGPASPSRKLPPPFTTYSSRKSAFYCSNS